VSLHAVLQESQEESEKALLVVGWEASLQAFLWASKVSLSICLRYLSMQYYRGLGGFFISSIKGGSIGTSTGSITEGLEASLLAILRTELDVSICSIMRKLAGDFIGCIMGRLGGGTIGSSTCSLTHVPIGSFKAYKAAMCIYRQYKARLGGFSMGSTKWKQRYVFIGINRDGLEASSYVVLWAVWEASI